MAVRIASSNAKPAGDGSFSSSSDEEPLQASLLLANANADADSDEDGGEDGYDGEFEVERIEGIRRVKEGARRVIQYRVKWKGFGEDETSWEPEENVQHAKALVDEFNRRRIRSAQQSKTTNNPSASTSRCRRLSSSDDEEIRTPKMKRPVARNAQSLPKAKPASPLRELVEAKKDADPSTGKDKGKAKTTDDVSVPPHKKQKSFSLFINRRQLFRKTAADIEDEDSDVSDLAPSAKRNSDSSLFRPLVSPNDDVSTSTLQDKLPPARPEANKKMISDNKTASLGTMDALRRKRLLSGMPSFKKSALPPSINTTLPARSLPPAPVPPLVPPASGTSDQPSRMNGAVNVANPESTLSVGLTSVHGICNTSQAANAPVPAVDAAFTINQIRDTQHANGPFTITRNSQEPERATDPRLKRPGANARSSAAPQFSSTQGDTSHEYPRREILRDLEARIHNSEWWKNSGGRTLFARKDKLYACLEALQMNPGVAARFRGRCCSIPHQGSDGYNQPDDNLETQAVEIALTGMLLLEIGARSPTNVEDIDVLLLHRQKTLEPVISCLVSMVNRTPRVEFFAIGNNKPVSSVFSYGFLIVPLYSALRDTTNVVKLLNRAKRSEGIQLLVHPASIAFAKNDTKSRAEPQLGVLKKHIESEHLPLVKQEDVVAGLSCDSQTVFSRPFDPISSEMEYVLIEQYLLMRMSQLEDDTRHAIIVALDPSDSLPERAVDHGIEIMDWAQLNDKLEDEKP